MIHYSKLEKPYEEYTIRSMVNYICDYCGKEFLRVKKSRERCNKNTKKDSCGAKNCMLAKQRDTAQTKHGVDNYFLTDEFKEKQKNTNIKKFGSEEYFSSEDFKSKKEQSMIEKYGVSHSLQSEEIRKKQQDTLEKIYGVKNYTHHPDYLEKVIKTNQERFGADSAMQNKDVVEKRRQTYINEYGCDSYTQTEEYWDKRKKSTLEKYGVEHTHQVPDIVNKARQTCLERYGETSYSKTEEYKQRVKDIFWERYGVPNPLCLKENQVYGKCQTEICEWLNSYGFNFVENKYGILKNKEIDLYDENLKLGIEYGSIYWHTEMSKTSRDKHYHANKYLDCKKLNIRLITIWDDEWNPRQKQCKSFLLSTLGISQYKTMARKCNVQEIPKQEFNEFCDEYHIQGSNNNGMCFLGIIDNDLLGVMSLGRHPRQSNKIVMDRLCFKSGVQVSGGASKLFSYCKEFVNKDIFDKFDRSEIISWSDNRWSDGNVYNKLGFKLDEELKQDFNYVDLSKPYKRISKQSQKDKESNCPNDQDIGIWMFENFGLARLWDCGKKRWSYKL